MLTTTKLLYQCMSNNIFISDTHGQYGGKMKYLYWRENVLWCTFPLPGYPAQYSLKIKAAGTAEDKKVCERLGFKVLNLLRTRHVEGKLFNYSTFKQRMKCGSLFDIFDDEVHKKYNPKFWRLVARYWYYKLRHKKSGQNDRYHLKHSLKKFGSRYASAIQPHEVTQWLERMKGKSAINTINLRLSYMQAVFNYANDMEEKFKLNYNPTRNISKLKGGSVRNYLLTPEIFDRNYNYLLEKFPRYALFYLALWETGRRPMEVARYTWEMYDIKKCVIFIPESITKTEKPDEIPFSGRLHKALLSVKKKTGLMFPNKLGNPFVYLTEKNEYRNNNHRYMKALRKQFGDVGVARDTRRGFTTRKCDDEGIKLDDVMLMSGHTTYSTAKRYRIGSLETKRKVIENHSLNDELPANAIPFRHVV